MQGNFVDLQTICQHWTLMVFIWSIPFEHVCLAPYLGMANGILDVVGRDGQQRVQQDILLAGVAAVAVDVDQVAAQASVHFSQPHSLQPVLLERNVILLHHGFHHLPVCHTMAAQ